MVSELITTEQIRWFLDNILWLVPTILFVFSSITIGFWKLIGKLFRIKSSAKEVPQEEAISDNSSNSLSTIQPEVSQQVPQVPVEDKEEYLDLTK